MTEQGLPEAGNSGKPDLEARMARARARRVFMATPVARHPVRQFTVSVTQTHLLLTQLGIQSWMQYVVGNSNLCRARNELVAGFLASGYEDMLFIDDDMSWNANDVVRLLASEREIIGGVGCKKVMLPDTDQRKWCLRILDTDVQQDALGAIEVAALGTGFLKISRPVFEKWIAAHPDKKLLPPVHLRESKDAMAHMAPWYYRFFEFPVDETGEEYGEDIGFCLEARRLGFTVWMDPNIKLGHVGEYEYTGDISAILQPAEKT